MGAKMRLCTPRYDNVRFGTQLLWRLLCPGGVRYYEADHQNPRTRDRRIVHSISADGQQLATCMTFELSPIRT
jgi:hypothetical protein